MLLGCSAQVSDESMTKSTDLVLVSIQDASFCFNVEETIRHSTLVLLLFPFRLRRVHASRCQDQFTSPTQHTSRFGKF